MVRKNVSSSAVRLASTLRWIGASQVRSSCPLRRAAAKAKDTSRIPKPIANRLRESSRDAGVTGGTAWTCSGDA